MRPRHGTPAAQLPLAPVLPPLYHHHHHHHRKFTVVTIWCGVLPRRALLLMCPCQWGTQLVTTMVVEAIPRKHWALENVPFFLELLSCITQVRECTSVQCVSVAPSLVSLGLFVPLASSPPPPHLLILLQPGWCHMFSLVSLCRLVAAPMAAVALSIPCRHDERGKGGRGLSSPFVHGGWSPCANPTGCTRAGGGGPYRRHVHSGLLSACSDDCEHGAAALPPSPVRVPSDEGQQQGSEGGCASHVNSRCECDKEKMKAVLSPSAISDRSPLLFPPLPPLVRHAIECRLWTQHWLPDTSLPH